MSQTPHSSRHQNSEQESQNRNVSSSASYNPTNSGTTNSVNDDEVSSSILDCPICLQPCVHPVEIPCGHIFCFLCIKGVATQGGQQPRCAICRSNIPPYVLTNPRLKDISQLYKYDKSDCGFQWFYESRSGGWWLYEERTMQELEKAFEAKENTCELLIAGHMYEIDFTQMIQFRVGNRNLFRRIKRDIPTAEKRGIAGIRIQSQLLQQQVSTSRRRSTTRSPASSNYTNGRPNSSSGPVPSVSPFSSASPAFFHSPDNTTPLMSPISQQSEPDDDDLHPDEDIFTDSDDEEEDDMELGEEEEESDTDDDDDDPDNEDEELRDGARAPTSRSDRSTSSFHNQTPPPRLSSASGGVNPGNSSSRKNSKCNNRTTPPSATPGSTNPTGDNPNSPSPSLVSANLCSSPPSILISPGPNSFGVSTSIQIGPSLRITVEYDDSIVDEIL